MMNKIYKLVSKAPNYIRRFGVIDGMRLLYQIESLRQLPQKSERIKQYLLPGFYAPIYLRDCIGDHAIFWQCLVMNQYDFSHFPQAERLNGKYNEIVSSERTPLIIDCGGNIGLSVVWFATKFPKAKIYVIEPDQANFEILKLNVASFKERVVILNGGIWNEAGYLQIINPDSGPSAYRVQLSNLPDSPNAIRCYTINEICSMANIYDPLIVKVDIEGSQKDLFAGNTDWVNNTDLITLELDDWLLPWQGTSRSFFKCLSQYSFDYLLNGESIFCFKDQSI
jgi:FkbM family methyltransferase